MILNDSGTWQKVVIAESSYYMKMSSGVLEINSYILSDDKDYRCKKELFIGLKVIQMRRGTKLWQLQELRITQQG